MVKNIGDQISALTADFKVYLNLRINLVGLLLSKRIAALTSMLVTTLLILGLVSMVILMLSFAFVFWYGEKVGNHYEGFLILAGFYLFLGLLIFLGRKKFFVEPMINKINEKMASGDFTGLGQTHQGKFLTLDDHIAFLTREVERSETEMQQDYEALTTELQPANLIKNAVGNLLTSPALITTALDIAIKLLRKNKQKKSEDQSDS